MDFFIAARLPVLRNEGNLVISICPQNAVKPGQSQMNTEEEEGRELRLLCAQGPGVASVPQRLLVKGWRRGGPHLLLTRSRAPLLTACVHGDANKWTLVVFLTRLLSGLLSVYFISPLFSLWA